MTIFKSIQENNKVISLWFINFIEIQGVATGATFDTSHVAERTPVNLIYLFHPFWINGRTYSNHCLLLQLCISFPYTDKSNVVNAFEIIV